MMQPVLVFSANCWIAQPMSPRWMPGFTFAMPEGATFVFADCSSLGVGDDRAAWRHLLDNYGLATLPGRCFFRATTKTQRLRFCFSRKEETLKAAVAALAPLAGVDSTGGA